MERSSYGAQIGRGQVCRLVMSEYLHNFLDITATKLLRLGSFPDDIGNTREFTSAIAKEGRDSWDPEKGSS